MSVSYGTAAVEQHGSFASRTMPARPARRFLHRGLLRTGSLLVFIAVFTAFSLASPLFLTFANIVTVIGQSAVVGILAFGLTSVIIGGGADVVRGGIDLSLASNLGLGSAVYASLVQAGYGDAAAIAATLAVGLSVGTVNAISIVSIGILPLLATVAVMNICGGLELVLTQNTAISVSTPLLDLLSGTDRFGIPFLAYVIVAVAAILIVTLQYTAYGLRLYAVGEHREAARAAGLPVQAYVVSSYLISGLCGGIAAILYTALLSGSTTGSGEMLLPVVATALLGNVFSGRLLPTIGGTLLSTLLIGFLANGFQLLHVSSYWVSGIQGLLILSVVAATSLVRRRRS
ncbi:MAG TPA: ABC transporter permease [Dongiaceae bacterium]|nr:ABC transporter permease [Dongiaceae bacterium]